MKNLLIVEDEKRINQALYSYFSKENYNVFQAYDGKEALDLFENHVMDIVILDIMLPKIDGFEVCRSMRRKSDVMIIMLTALSTEEDILRSFELGADEYVSKPFSPKVLVARVKALEKRLGEKPDNDSGGGIVIDNEAYKVYVDDLEIEMTPIEYLIMQCFVLNRDIALSRNQILDYAWGETYFGDDRVVDTHVKNLRKKLGEKGRYIRTIKNVGYRFEVKK